MKKFKLFILALLTANIVTAQLPKGTLLLDGTFDANIFFDEGNNLTSVGIVPEVGIFLNEKFVLIAQLRAFSFSDGGNGGGALTLIPSARYYFKNDETPVKWFGQFGLFANINFGNTDFGTLGANLGFGNNIFLNDQIALETTLTLFEEDLTDNSGFYRLGITSGFQFFLTPGSSTEEFSVTKDGKWFVGGTTGFIDLSSFINEGSFIDLTLSPNVGYFLNENFAIGAQVPISFSNSDFISSNSFGLSPFLRYYFTSSKARFHPFATVGAGIEFNRVKFKQTIFTTTEQTTSGSQANFNVGAGANIFLSDWVALEGILSFNARGENDSFGSPSQEFISFNIGLQLFLGK